MKKIGLTIIIPCYNSADSILYSLKSITGNIIENYEVEIIVIDDCSQDDTFEIVKKYSNYINSENIVIKLFKNEYNIGAGESRNVGMRYATKEYITFLDSDDILVESFFSTLLLTLLGNNDVVVFDAFRKFGKSKQYMNMFYTAEVEDGLVDVKRALVYMNGSTCGKIYKLLLVKEHDAKFGRTPRMEDLVFSKTVVSFATRIFYVKKPLYIYNNNLASLTNDLSLLNSENIMAAFDEIKSKINNKNFRDELNSIYFLEVVYMLVMNKIRGGLKTKEIKNIYKKYINNYNRKDKYINGYRKRYKIAYWLFECGLFDAIRLFIRFRNKGK